MCGILDILSDTGCNGEEDSGCVYADFDYSGTCIVNNTRYQTVRLPRRFNDMCADENKDYLVCITEISAAYDGIKKVHLQ